MLVGVPVAVAPQGAGGDPLGFALVVLVAWYRFVIAMYLWKQPSQEITATLQTTQSSLSRTKENKDACFVFDLFRLTLFARV